MIHSDHVAMIRSAVVAAVLVALLLLALIWHPQGATGSGGSPPTEPVETASQTPATVQVTLSPAEEPVPPSGQQTSLASLEEGARDSDSAADETTPGEDTAETDSASPPPTTSADESPAEPSAPEPAKPPESAAEDASQASDEQPPPSTPDDAEPDNSEPDETKPDETTDAQTPDSAITGTGPVKPPERTTPDATPPTDEPADRSPVSGVRAAADGAIPRLRHTGEVELMRTTWPRLEVAWVTQPPLRPDDEPRTLVEAVLDPSGHVRWQNLKTKTQSRGFSFTTMRYNTGGRVRIADPTTLQLWKHRDRIAAIADVPPDQTQRFQWGYYRHRAEVFELARAEAAFRTAESAGQLTFDPARSDVLEVTWGTGPKQRPTIVAARFLPGDGEPVLLKLP